MEQRARKISAFVGRYQSPVYGCALQEPGKFTKIPRRVQRSAASSASLLAKTEEAMRRTKRHRLVSFVVFTLFFSYRRLGYIESSWPARLNAQLSEPNLLLDSNSRQSRPLRIVSWNLRVPFPQDEAINRTWAERREAIAKAIAILQPGVLLLQEDYFSMNDELLHQIVVPALNGLNGSNAFLSNTYQRYGLFNRNGESQPSPTWPENAFTGDGVRDGEHNSIWWSQRSWKLMKASSFWLSHTPQVPGTSFGEVTGRIVNCVILRNAHTDKAHPDCRFCSVHLPSQNVTKQILSTEVLSSRFAEDQIEASYSFVGGDFNTEPKSSVYNAMLDHGFNDVAASSMPKYDEVVSTSDWYKEAETNQLIDFLWIYNKSSRSIQTQNSVFVSIPCCGFDFSTLREHIETQIRGEELSSTHSQERPASDHRVLVVDIVI